ncbi:putative ribonuclease H-like domain-containing protein [Tanacetum coccineum]|uniref:Ribonuclease H-like domain-containing protein n=1 Tax=Tanacetum coccineum TaxID=301880 RepID=A0ABQ4ZP09_9ASTR
MSFDDLYNNFKIVEQEVKRTVTSSSKSSSQNMAIMSYPRSTNEVNTNNVQVSTANSPLSTDDTPDSTANLSDVAVYAFLLALLSMRARRGPRNQDNRNRNQDSSRRTVNVEETSSKAMVAIDGAGFDWSFMADEEVPTNMALMAFSDSEFNKSEFNLATYKRGLASVEEQLVFYKKNEVMFYDQIVVLKRDTSFKDSKINALKSEIEKLKKEKESNQIKIDKFENASKSLNKLIGSQISDKSRKGVGFVSYNVVLPPPTGLFAPLTIDLSNSSLEEFQQPEFEGYGPKASKSVYKDTSNEVKKTHDTSLGKKLVSEKEKQTIFPTKIESAKQQEKSARKPVNFDRVQAHCNYHQREGVVNGNNYTRGNYNNSAKKAHPNSHGNMTPRAVLMKIGLKPLNIARPVNIDHPRTIVYSARPMSINIAKEKVYTAKPKAVNTTRPTSAVVNAVKENQGHPQKEDQGYVDSGCSRHMTGNMSYLSYFKEFDEGYVTFGGGGRVTGKRTLKTSKFDFEDVYFVKELQFNLFSVSQMCDKKNSVLFTDTACFVLSPDFKLPDESQVLLKVPRKNNMYSVDMKNIVPKESLTCLVAKATLDESMLWHRRLGHVNFKTINKLVKDNLVRGLPAKRFENDQTCVACLKGKQHKASCKSKIQNSITQPLFMLHMDLFGPTFVSSLMNKKYCLVVTDDYSRFTWVFFLASKDETSGILKNFITEIENLVDKKVKIIRCDNGTEFKNRVINETLIEAARTILADSKLPTTFWAEAVNTTCYVQNRVIIVKPHNKTPYELFRGRTPALSFMRPFGCHVTILNTLDHLGKFDGKSDDGFFVGYSLTSKAFRVYNIRTRKVEENLHIRFLENKPIVTGDGPKWLFDIDSLTKSMNYVPVVVGTNSNDFSGSKESNGAGHTSKETEFSQDYIVMPLWKDGSMFDSSSKNSSDDKPQPSSNAEKKDDEGVSKASGFSDQEQPESSTPNINTVGPSINTASANFKTGSLNINVVSPTVITTRSNRSQNVSDMFSLGRSATLEATHADLFGDETEMDMSNLTTSYQVPTTPNTRIHKDHSLDHVIGDIQSGVQTRGMTKNTNKHGFISAVYEGKTHKDLHTCLFACFLSQEEPKRIAKALCDPAWVEAMQEELLQFKLQKVWILVDLPKGKRAIGTKWIFRNKKDESGIVTRNKARLVFQGYTQEEGVDYDKVFAHVARIEAIRLFLAYASFMGFMVYIDDVIFGSTNKELCSEFEKLMHDKFRMSSMGELNFFLGLQVKQREDGIFISQDKYVAEILRKFGFTDVRTASTSMDTKKPLLKDSDGDDVDVHLYRSMIESLMYLTSSRPDIMYLKGQPKLCLWYPRNSPFDLVAYSDSDYAGASLDKKSTTGGCQFLGYALTKSPTIYVSLIEQFWQTTSASTLENGDIEITATIDGKVNEIFEQLALMGASKGYTGVDTPLFQTMLVQGQILQGEGSTIPVKSHHTPTVAPSTSQPHHSPTLMNFIRQETDVSQPSSPTQTHVADEAASTGVDDRHGGATTTVSGLEAGQGSGNIHKTPTMPHDSPLLRVYTLGSDEGRMQPNESMELVTKLSIRVVVLENDLKQTKKTYGAAFTKLIKKVKTLEKTIKSSKARRRAQFVVSDDEEEDSFNQGRKIVEIDEDPDISFVQQMIHHDAQTQERKEYDLEPNFEFTAPEEVYTAEPDISTANIPVSTAAKSLVYIRRSAAKRKDKGKAIVEESDPTQTKTKIQQEQESLGFEEAQGLQEQFDKEERQRIASVHEEARNHTLQQLRGYSFDEIKVLFEATVKRVNTFTLMESDDTVPKVIQENTRKSSEWVIIQRERLCSTEPTDDKERELWVELKRLFEPDTDDLLELQRYMHDPLTWRELNTAKDLRLPEEDNDCMKIKTREEIYLEEIQEQNTQPSEYTRERHNKAGHVNVKAQSDVTQIHRTARISQVPE